MRGRKFLCPIASLVEDRHARILLGDEAKFIDFTHSRSFMTRANVVIG